MKKLVVAVVLGVSWMLFGVTCRSQTAIAQERTSRGAVISTQDVGLLRKDLRAKRKQLVAENLKLTDAEGERFWPVYEQYIRELIAINDKKFALIQNYADTYGKMTNDDALLFIRQWLDVDIASTQLRQ